jgi:hypothetical protein
MVQHEVIENAKANGHAASTQLALRPTSHPPAPVFLGGQELQDVMKLGEVFAKSGFFKDAREAAQCVVKIVAGRELGIPATAAMRGVHVFEGQTTLHAHTIGALIKRARPRYDYKVRESTHETCSIEFYEDGELAGVVTWTRKDAERAQLDKKPVWIKHPRQMLYARAMTEGARMYCSEVFNGAIYTPEEMGAEVNEAGDVIDVTPRSTVEQPPQQARPVELASPSDESDAERASHARRVSSELKRLGVRKDESLRQVFLSTVGQGNMVGVPASILAQLADDLAVLDDAEALKGYISRMYASRGVVPASSGESATAESPVEGIQEEDELDLALA